MTSKPVLCDFARRLLGKSQESFLIGTGLVSNDRLQALAVRIASARPERLSPIGVLVPHNSDGYRFIWQRSRPVDLWFPSHPRLIQAC
jgi:hypothetical protein